ncbi:virulence factor TspB C-terminal domain-related protein [Pseudomonas viridiflava]|uniref:virulence factor TspB C-terminal domain-related protein n=1 Tax=Pseudomonas viridiflava TaxID=33069 RepID=UPI0013D9AA08|nr:virulence factor TspB C-terminal domain-related protein [Pseudomonas viridiflava]
MADLGIGKATTLSMSMASDGLSGTCVYSYTDQDGNTQTIRSGGVSRQGDACPDDYEYNPQTYACTPKVDPSKDCSDGLGVTSEALGLMTQLTDGVQPTNKSICDNGCKAVYTAGGSSLCATLKSDPTGPKYCIFKFTGNGSQCDGSEASSTPGAPAPATPPKDPNDPTDPQNNCKGAGMVWSGTTCVKYWEPDKADTGGGGGTGTGSGGGSSGGGSSGGGSGTGGSGTKPSTGTGDAPPPGTPNGGGGGDGEGKDDEKDQEASSSQDCTKPPVCDGDVFSCAILNQNYFDSCRLISLPTDKELIGRDKEIKKQQDTFQESQDKMDSDVSGFISKFTSAGSGGYGGGKCYPDKQVSIAGRTVQLPFSQICDPLVILRYGLLAAAYLAAARILSKEA